MNAQVLPIDTASLGDRSYLVHDGELAVVVDPQRDIDRVLDLAGREQVRISAVFETHLHNDYVSGGLALARATGARYLLSAEDEVAFARTDTREITADDLTSYLTPTRSAFVDEVTRVSMLQGPLSAVRRRVASVSRSLRSRAG